MLEELCKDFEIKNYLEAFPKVHWKKCIHLSLLYAIRQIQEEKFILNVNTLEQIVPKARKTQKKNLGNRKSPKCQRPNTSIPTFVKEKVLQPGNRLSSPNFLEKKFKNMPKYLKNVESKIKIDVQKDVAMHNYKKEILTSPKYQRKFNKSLPDLIEVVEPNTCPLESVKKGMKDIGEIAEKFLNNPFTRVLSPN